MAELPKERVATNKLAVYEGQTYQCWYTHDGKRIWEPLPDLAAVDPKFVAGMEGDRQ